MLESTIVKRCMLESTTVKRCMLESTIVKRCMLESTIVKRYMPERHFQVEESIIVENPGAYFTLKISANQRFETYADLLCPHSKDSRGVGKMIGQSSYAIRSHTCT